MESIRMMASSSTSCFTSLPSLSSSVLSKSSLLAICSSRQCLVPRLASLSHAGICVPPRKRSFNGAQLVRVISQAKSEDVESIGGVGIGAVAGGLVANPVVVWSLYVLKTTGCGLPPGPGGSLGALEGVSYLVILGVVGWSIYTKVKTGSGLPSGPLGLLGAVEGLSYLTVLAIVVVFGFQALDHGFIPGPLPGEQCFG